MIDFLGNEFHSQVYVYEVLKNISGVLDVFHFDVFLFHE